MKTCLLLGAGGFIGKNLCSALAGKYRIIAFDRADGGDLSNIGQITWIKGDFSSIKDFSSLVEGVDLIFHLISTTLPDGETSGIPTEIEQNIIPTVRLLESLTKGQRIIFASSGGTIYGESKKEKNMVGDPLHPICSYGVQKKVIEAYLDFYGLRRDLDYRIARITNPYGLGQDPGKPQGVIPIFAYRLFRGMPISVYGETLRDYIYMDDLIDALLRLSQYEGEQRIFNIGSGQVHSLTDIITLMTRIACREFASITYSSAREFDVSRTAVDITVTKEALGWDPRTSLEEGIRMIVAHYEKYEC